MKYELKNKSNILFTYEQDNGNYISAIELCQKDTTKGYKGIQISCYEKEVNREGFNNSIGIRKPELFLIPFWILHFKFYRLFYTIRNSTK